MNPAATHGWSISPAALQQRRCCPVLPFLTSPNSSPLASFSSRRTSPTWIGFGGVFMPPCAAGLPLQLPSRSAVVALLFPSSPAPTPRPQPPPPRGGRLRFGSQVPPPRYLHPHVRPSVRRRRDLDACRFGLGCNRDEKGQIMNSSSESERI